MMNKQNLLIIFAKHPQVGEVKTRLGVGVGLDCACELYESFLGATVTIALGCNADVCLAIAPETSAAGEYFETNFGSVSIEYQKGDTLGDRLHNSIKGAFAAGRKKVCVIGSDSPDLPALIIHEAFAGLDAADCVIGPSADGGFYLIGMSASNDSVFKNVEWSSDTVFESVIKNAGRIGLTIKVLQSWSDVDDVYDAIRLRDRLAALQNPEPYQLKLLDEVRSILMKKES